MKYSRLEIPEVILCEPTIHKDNRGYVFESFKDKSLNDFLRFQINFCQDNISFSSYGVIRGLHSNTLNFAQNKLVSVLNGEILDVAVDFRKNSPTFGKIIKQRLSSKNRNQLLVPKGFLHGFSVLSEDATVMIKVDKYFASGESIGIRFDDDFLNIDWGIPKNKIILSSLDLNLKNFNETSSPFEYNKINY